MLILILLFVSFKKPIVPPPTSHSKKITLDLASFVPPVPKQKPKPIIKPQPKIKPKVAQKPIQKKPIVIKKEQPKEVKLPPKKSKTIAKTKSETTHESNTTKIVKTKVIKKHTKKIKVAKKAKKQKIKKVTKKRYTKKVHKRKYKTHKKRNSLASALAPSSNYKSMYKRPSNGFGMQTIRKLYGKEYDGFSAKQKEFIRTNLGLIHRITQRVLIQNGYPQVAIQTNQQGTNVVSFYLHPNGDISHLKLKRRIGYSALDNNTLEVIRIAYKDYPLPAKKTKIIFYVSYSIY